MFKRELQKIVEAGSVADKSQLASTLGELYLDGGKDADAAELSLFFDIVRHLIRDVEKQVRSKLSGSMAARADVPRDLILMLANDVIEVAYPVLANSPVLRDEDLVALVLERATEYRQAIAERKALSPNVSRSIVSTGDVPAVTALLRNGGAEIDEETMTELVETAAGETAYQELLISRKDLPEAVANTLYDHVSGALRDYLMEAFPGIGDDIDVAMSDAVERALEEDRGNGSPDFSVLDWNDAGTTNALVRALELEDILRFEDLFQQATDLSAPQAARAMYDMGPEGLAIACKGIELDREAFGKIFCHLRGKRPFDAFRQSTQYASGMAYFDGLATDNAKSILDEWRAAGKPQ